MAFNLNEVTRKIERQISISLAFACLCQLRDNPSVGLMDLYTHVRHQVGCEVTAGLFNKVVDDMTRIGLLQVDRKTKEVVNIRGEKLAPASELLAIGNGYHYNAQTGKTIIGWEILAGLRSSTTAEQAKEFVEEAAAITGKSGKAGV